MLIVQRRRLLLYPSYVQDYLDRVTAADVAAGNTQGLELGVTDAFNTTLQNLVGDSVLGVSGGVIAQPASTIKAMPFMVGARTLQGCLVPVVGAAPTNFSFVAGDYNRKTGLVGDGSTKYLDTNRNNNSDPQNSQHLSVHVSTLGTLLALSGLTDSAAAGISHIGAANVRSRNSTPLGVAMQTGFNGISRNNSANFQQRVAASTATLTQASQPPANQSLALLRTGSFYGTHRIAYYSIGESLDLALLDARVTALINAIAAAIP
jgi:hypothetical protein